MTDGGADDLGERVLVLAPTARDGAASRELLAAAGVHACVCATLADVCREAARGAGAAVVTAEAVAGDAAGDLAALLRDQPPWSDLPLIVLTPPGDDSPRLLHALDAVGPMTLMKRPVHVSALVSAVRAALRDRKRQYAVREFLEDRERYRVTLASIGDAVVATDTQGRVTFLNPVAEALTGWPHAAAAGRPLGSVLRLVHETSRREVENPALRALREGAVVGLTNHTVLVARDGTERPIDDSAAPIRDEAGRVRGAVMVFRDISERKAADEARARLSAIVESSDDAIVGKTLDGVIRYWNAGAERIFGWAAAEAVGRPITLLIPPDRLDEERAIIARLRRGERIAHFETVRVTKDGRQVDISLTVSPIRDHEGNVIGASKVARDVTDRRRAEAERARLVETLRLAMDVGEQGTWEWDPATDGIVLSDRAGEIYGVEPGRPHSREQLRSLLHPDHRDRSRQRAAEAVAARADYDIEYPLVSGRWVAARGRGVSDEAGRLTRVIGVVQDVTERRRAEAELRERDERLQLAVAIARMGTFEIDLATDAVTVNGPGRDIYGWSDTRTTFAQVQTHFHPADRDAVMRQVRAALDPAGPGGFEVEQRVVRTDGAVRWLRVRGRALFDGDGPARRAAVLIGAFLDVTDQKEAEHALREADQKKDDFIALLAHELRNPLAPIRNGLQVLRLSDDRAARDRAQKMMDRQLTHMVRMIDDLLDVSRITRNKMGLRRARVTLADVVASAVETARPAIEEAGHELAVSLPAEPVPLDADLTRLSQVFSNLLTNSAKYTGRGGSIRLAAARRGGAVVVTVRDNGIGIPAAALPRIFDMFSQVDRSTERTTGGLGIGLALVKGLVEMHGGTVAADSAGEGRGSTFTVTLPTPADEPRAAAASPAAGAGPGPGRRILVVDDNRDGAESLAEMLALLGNEVETAGDGVEAVDAAERFRPEVILMDVGMPRLNGLDATRRIRERPWGRAVTVVALTGWGQEADRERTRAAGCDGHLVKPVNLPDLEAVLSKLVGLKRG